MNDERVERLRDYLYRNNSGRIEAGRLMDLAKSCLRAYDKLAEENERLRKERDEAEQRGRREERFRFWRAVLDGGIEITDSGQYRADIESSVHHALEQAKQRGAQRERERIARLFDDLYPEWAQMIREGVGDE
jgi:hypothetical protein